VAPAPIENLINEHPLVELSCVSGVGQPAAFALVVLAEDIRGKLNDPERAPASSSELADLARQVNSELSTYEQLQMFVIAKEPWTIENGMLTPTMKIKRAKIEEHIKPKIAAWFDGKKKVVWE
jgi:long-chain acyl-CoA synthetase